MNLGLTNYSFRHAMSELMNGLSITNFEVSLLALNDFHLRMGDDEQAYEKELNHRMADDQLHWMVVAQM